MPKEIYRIYCSSKREKTGVAEVMRRLIEALDELARYLGLLEQHRPGPTQDQINAALDDARARWPNAFQGQAAEKLDDPVTEAPSLRERYEAAQVEIAALRKQAAKTGAASTRHRASPLAVALRLVRT
jgi:hypothetical protein